MKNKSNNKFFGNTISPVKECDEKNCDENGDFIAPKSPNSNEKYFFCLKHIKLYNKRWNFFAGKSQNEIYKYQKNDFFEGRPTYPFSRGASSKIKFEFNFKFEKDSIGFKERSKRFVNDNVISLNGDFKKALNIFKLDRNFNKEDLKRKYKVLVKKYHPDVKNKIKNKEKKIKEINNAYKILINNTKD